MHVQQKKKYKSDLHAIAAAYFSIATYYAQINFSQIFYCLISRDF